MLLTIDEAKVRESLAAFGKPSYVVTASHLVAVEPPPAAPPDLCVGGTMTLSAPRVSTATREYVTSLRRKIEESGVPLKSADELSKEIDETRGRGH